jgi:hypothetical protein
LLPPLSIPLSRFHCLSLCLSVPQPSASQYMNY